jgi:hypothetical protein
MSGTCQWRCACCIECKEQLRRDMTFEWCCVANGCMCKPWRHMQVSVCGLARVLTRYTPFYTATHSGDT